MGSLYVFDASSLVQMRWKLPPEWCEQMLDRFAVMASGGRWISVGQVLTELREQEDYLAEWAVSHRELFPEANEQTQTIVREILRRFPRLVIPDKETPDADPFVIAEALRRTRSSEAELFTAGPGTIVVSEERIKPDRPTIPSVCQHYNIDHTNLFGFVKEEGIRLTA